MDTATNNVIVGEFDKILNHPLFDVGKTPFTLWTVLAILFWLVLVLLVSFLMRRFVVQRLLKRTRFDPSLQYAIHKITGYVFITLGFFIALQVNHVDLSSLAVIAGAVGVGVGFGLQNIINNFVSGLIILAERPITIGDRIEVGTVAGQVTRISLRSTIVVTNDNISIIVPNSDFISHAVTNWSHGDPRVRMRLSVGVAYGTDPEKLKSLLLEVAQGHPKVLADPPPDVFFSGFGDSSLNFELAVWTAEMSSKPRRFRSELYYAIEKKLRENKIEIPFPQRDLHLRTGSLVVAPPSTPTNPNAAAPE
ncbi:MAG TPA: mechanosensitive ion channel domain-containing protein [Verrucomicrobiae bacterium]